MDRKTVEYMENRVTKANTIIGRIDRIKDYKEKINYIGIGRIEVSGMNKGGSYNFAIKDSDNMSESLERSLLSEMEKEIDRLELELAEL